MCSNRAYCIRISTRAAGRLRRVAAARFPSKRNCGTDSVHAARLLPMSWEYRCLAMPGFWPVLGVPSGHVRGPAGSIGS